MLGSISSELLPTDDSGTPGSRVLPARAPRPDAARREPAAATPLLRDREAALVGADNSTRENSTSRPGRDAAASAAVDLVVGQLAPIRSQASLLASFAREANPDDPIVREAYGCVWADLGLSMALGTTRRARARAALGGSRRGPLRGRG